MSNNCLKPNHSMSLTDKIEVVIAIAGYLMPLIVCLFFLVGIAFLMETRIGG